MRFRRGFCVIVGLLIAVGVTATAAAVEMRAPVVPLSFYCALGLPESITVIDRSEYTRVSLVTQVAWVPRYWDASQSIWRGYRAPQPFAQPADADYRWMIYLDLPDGSRRWIMILESLYTPSVYYAYAYTTLTPSTDANGDHYGAHPCRAFVIPAHYMTSLLQRLEPWNG
ncbi:MAG: hypothetical protein GYB67_01260 [Chloroflexi bacterium]|nr:hypothetical protein [Chloroflexota bacterium]